MGTPRSKGEASMWPAVGWRGISFCLGYGLPIRLVGSALFPPPQHLVHICFAHGPDPNWRAISLDAPLLCPLPDCSPAPDRVGPPAEERTLICDEPSGPESPTAVDAPSTAMTSSAILRAISSGIQELPVKIRDSSPPGTLTRPLRFLISLGLSIAVFW